MRRVAVIVPCHNDGTLAEEAVASVQDQGEVEVIVVDDASTDAITLDRLTALEERGVRVERRKQCGGPAVARTTGLSATSAPFVYPLDADDTLAQSALDAMANTLDGNPEAAFTWGDYEVFGDLIGRYRSPKLFLPWTLTYVNPYPICSLFRRAVLEQVGGWSDTQGYEDWDLWLKLVEHGLSGIQTGGVIYHRRLHGDTRRLAQDRGRHKLLYAELQQRHADLFARRDDLRRQELPATWKRAVYPVLFGSRSLVPFPIEAFMQRMMLRAGSGLPS